MANQIIATLTAIRTDGMQKWEREDRIVTDRSRYFWLQSFQSIKDAKVGSIGTLEFITGPGGAYSLYKVTGLIAA